MTFFGREAAVGSVSRLSGVLLSCAIAFGIGVTGAEAKIRVVTTLPSFADLAKRVGGEEVETVALTKGSQDPHFVDPKPGLALKLNRADLLIHAGLGLEDGWLPPVLTGARNGKIQTGQDGNLDASTLVEVLEKAQGKVDRSMGDVHPGGNPHYMLDPRNGVRVAKGIAERLGKLEPEKAADFKKRADELEAALKTRIEAWEKTLTARVKDQPVVTYHKTWVYFGAWAGWKEVGYVEPKPGIPPSPEHVVRLSRLMKEKSVKWVVIEPYYSRNTAEQVAQAADARLITLPTEVGGVEGVDSYEGIFEEILRRLSPDAKRK